MTLVDDLLDVSRITRGKLELRKSRVPLAEIMRSAVEASRPFIEESDHELDAAVPDRQIRLEADPNRLAQVFANLLNNAAKYTARGGRIEFKAERQDPDVVVTVKDNGIGIPADKLEDIFEMFSQIKSSEGSANPGLGIGLTLVKSLVEMHKGRIEVSSAGPQTGSEFRVFLPMLVEPAENTSKPESNGNGQAKPAGLRRKVLVVDDNLAAVHLLSRVIESLGNDVRTAGDGKEAIEVAARLSAGTRLMDLGMPRMNGFDAARHIRRQTWGQDMLLVALSGWGQEDDKRRTKEAGFDHHLTKPADPSELRRLLAHPERQLRGIKKAVVDASGKRSRR